MKTSRSVFAVLLSTLTALLLIAGPASAQNTTGTMRVVVTDDSGSAVSNVEIEISHIPTGRAFPHLTVTGNTAPSTASKRRSFTLHPP